MKFLTLLLSFRKGINIASIILIKTEVLIIKADIISRDIFESSKSFRGSPDV